MNAAVNASVTFGSATTGVGDQAQGDTLHGFTDISGSAFGDVLTDTTIGTVAFGGNDTGSGGAGNDRKELGGSQQPAQAVCLHPESRSRLIAG